MPWRHSRGRPPGRSARNTASEGWRPDSTPTPCCSRRSTRCDASGPPEQPDLEECVPWDRSGHALLGDDGPGSPSPEVDPGPVRTRMRVASAHGPLRQPLAPSEAWASSPVDETGFRPVYYATCEVFYPGAESAFGVGRIA